MMTNVNKQQQSKNMKAAVSIKRLTLIALGTLLFFQVQAQYATTFVFSETAPYPVLRTMENNAHALCAEIYRKYDKENSQLNIPPSVATVSAREKIETMWDCSHFYCTAPTANAIVMKRVGTDWYEVRNVPVYFCEGETDEYRNNHIVLVFNSAGKICDIGITPPKQDYIKILANGKEVTGENAREIEDIKMIEDFIDDFFSAYNCKNLDLLEKVYSEEALIITGRVVNYKTHSRRNNEFSRTLTNNTEIVFSIQSKSDYMKKLEGIFARNEFINIRFDGVQIVQSPGNPNRYGVWLNQYWHVAKKIDAPDRDYYRDEGKLFLLIDFTERDEPLIWVRTWQPFRDKKGNLIHYSEDDIWSFDDFPFEKNNKR